MNQNHPLWPHDIDEYSLDHARNRELLQNWLNEIVRDEIAAALTKHPDIDYYGWNLWMQWHRQIQAANPPIRQTHTRGPRATSSEERDS
jgi:hypothetical protein